MRLWPRRAETRASLEDPRTPISDTNALLGFFGVTGGNLPVITLDSALSVPAFTSAVTFLSSSLASLPLHAFKDRKPGSERLTGALQRIVNEAPNEEWSSYGWRKYLWQGVFTTGRGLTWIERSGSNIVAMWPMDPARTTVVRRGGRKFYLSEGRDYAATDVVDVPFLLKTDQLASYAPLVLAAKPLQLAIAMGDYAAGFFAGGGVPPLALVGPMPAGAEAIKRAQADIRRAIDAAKAKGEPVFPIPSGYELKPVGFDPAKGQMVEARRFQIEEFARVFNLPPVFLQDLTNGTFTNTEQQDLFLTKHLIAQWAGALEEELNLKLFGARNNYRYVEHNLDGLMRGDFKTRMEALAAGVNTALLTPNEARALDNRPPVEGGDKAYIQGATVPLGSQPTPATQPVAATPADPNPDGEPAPAGDTPNDGAANG